MNFKMKKIATAVAAGLGASIVGMSVSHSQDEILFPYLVHSDTVTSVVSVVNIEIGLTPGQLASDLHYTYWAKAGAAAENPTAACEELNIFRSTSPNDIQTFDVGDRFAQDNLGVLFNDPSINNPYIQDNLSYSTLRQLASPVRAFLIVDNNGGGAATSGEGSLYGEAVILDFGAGAAWGYRAYNALTREAFAADQPGAIISTNTFSNQFETEGEVLKDSTPVHLLPDDEFVVRFFVTPISPSVDDGSGQLTPDELGEQSQGGISARVRLAIPTSSNGVVFDRDENPISGRIIQPVTCVAGIDANGTLLSLGVLNELKQAGSDGGGWSYFETVNPPQDDPLTTPNEGLDSDTTNEVVAFRLDFNRANTFDGTPFVDSGDAFNSAVWLRNGTDRNLQYEQQVPIYTYDVPVMGVVPVDWPNGIPSQYRQ